MTMEGARSTLSCLDLIDKNKRASEESPTKLRALAPKSLFSESSEYIPLPKMPKKKVQYSDKKHVIRPILPKPYIHGTRGSSPTKAAALMLKRKATLVCQRMSPVKILPKQPNLESLSVVPAVSRVLTRSQGNKESDLPPVDNPSKQDGPQVKLCQPKKTVHAAEADTVPLHNHVNVLQDEDCEDTEKDEDQMQLDDLMAACTTISYDPKKSSNAGHDGDTKSKSQKRREICLSMLEEDILETDLKKDQRDIEYAKDYFNRVKQALQHEPDRFRQFLTKLHEMNKENGNPVKLYAEISSLLHDHQELVDDFAGFLLAHQAVECGCFVSFFQYQQLREFFRKLEIYCDNSTTLFQRILKSLSKLLTQTQEGQSEAVSFKDKLSSVLKNVPGILDELLDYYLDGQFPDSFSPPDEFEEVNLEAVGRVSGFEELTLPPGTETYNTKMCGCACHNDETEEKFHRRLRHCFSCSLKQLDNGVPILKISKYEYQQLTVIYPHQEREKLRKAKREAAQLALAKAKAQKSRNKKNKSKGSSSHSKSKRLSIKRKQRKRLPKSSKQCPVYKIISDEKTENNSENVTNHNVDSTEMKGTTKDTDTPLQFISNTTKSHIESQVKSSQNTSGGENVQDEININS